MNWIIGLVVLMAAIGVGAGLKDRIQLGNRKGLSKAEFCEVFRQESIPESLAAVVYDHYSSFALGSQVEISPDNSFDSLRIGQDDVDDDLQRLLKKLSLELPSSATLADWSTPVHTIGDAVRWLNWIRQHQET